MIGSLASAVIKKCMQEWSEIRQNVKVTVFRWWFYKRLFSSLCFPLFSKIGAGEHSRYAKVNMILYLHSGLT